MLTQAQIDFFHNNGYLAVEDVVPKQKVKELQRITEEFVSSSRHVAESNDIYDLEPEHSADTPRLRRLKSPNLQHAIYDEMMRADKILDMVAQLIGPGIRCYGQKLNMKSAEVGSPVEWHQDWAFAPHTNDDQLAVGIAIDDITQENGCLLVIPGSHNRQLYDHHQDGIFVGAITELDFPIEEAVPLLVRAGGITIHHVRTLHGSAKNSSDQARRLLLAEYGAVDAWPLMGVKNWGEFNSLILRGTPTAAPRMTAVPVRIPLPRPEHQGSIFEIQSQLKRPLYGN